MSEITPGRAQEINIAAQEELGKVILHEMFAKQALIATEVMGGNLVVIGEPGGGKSTLTRAGFELVDGILPHDIAVIPPQADLTPQAVVGGKAKMDKRIEQGGRVRKESTSTDIDAIVKHWTKAIYADEINRVNPAVLNSLLSAFEERVLTNSAGSVDMKAFEFAISTMNPAENRTGVFPISAAMASRLPLGVIMGAETGSKQREILKARALGFKGSRSDINPVMNLSELHSMRRGALATALPEGLADKAVDITLRLRSSLRDGRDGKPEIKEAPERMIGQIANAARTLAYLNGHARVGERHIARATRMVATARLGAISPDAYRQVDGVVDYALAK